MNRRLETRPGEWIDRDEPLKFSFEGKEYTGFSGDTITSALWASGERILGRSFKYHRPRGILSLSNHDVNILVTDMEDTNIRADVVNVKEGMRLLAVNTSGGVKKDKKRWLDRLSAFMPVGFYYKAFHSPRKLFPFWENVIRKSAGLGEVNFNYPRTIKTKYHEHCDLLIVGAGTAGLSAALHAAKCGIGITLVDENRQAGGSLTYDCAGDQESKTVLRNLLDEIKHHPNITLLTGVYAAGYYTDHYIPLVREDGITNMRAKAVVIATGAYEQPPVFRNNDLPGVMLGTAAQRLIHRYSVRPFDVGVVFTANDQGYRVALDLLEAGVEVAALVDLRKKAASPLADKLLQLNIRILKGYCIYEAIPTGDHEGVKEVVICPFDESSGKPDTGDLVTIACDGIAMCAGWAPAAALLYQAGVSMRYDNTVNQFVPNKLPKGVFAAGKVNGRFDLESRLKDGQRAASEVLSMLSETSIKVVSEPHEGNTPSHTFPFVPHPKAKNFIDFDEDIQLKDFINAAQEGFDNIELMKRFTTVGMGPSQGKHSNMNAIRILAKIRDLPVEKIGSTTARPFFHPTPIGHLAGRTFHPHRLTSLHDWHQTAQADFIAVGAWLRPAYYSIAGLSRDDAIIQEVLSVRQAVGMIDVGTLGKIEVHGPDSALFLERFYTGGFANQKIGSTRYALALDEAGVILDDGIVARLADDLFYLTASTSNSAMVYREMQRWQQKWQLDIGLVNVTGYYGAINVAGVAARKVLSKLCKASLSEQDFSFGSIIETVIAEVPARIIRVGFVSELAYEIHVASQDALTVWVALMEAGEPEKIRPFGVEAQRILRLEMGHSICGHDTDGLTNPLEAGLMFAVKPDKPFFIGQRSLQIIRKAPIRKSLVPFLLDHQDGMETPKECNLVIAQGDIAGRVTSIAFSPTLKQAIGLAYVSPELAIQGGSFLIRTDNGSLVKAIVAQTPFVTSQIGDSKK